MPQEVRIDGKPFVRVKIQRSATAVYRGESAYARVGDPQIIARDLATHQEMDKLGYPVPRILGQGTCDGRPYFLEESFGEDTFRAIFARDCAAHGAISDEHFSDFLRLCITLLDAQKRSPRAKQQDSFASGIRLELLKSELPAEADRIQNRFDAACERLSAFPYALSHGDMNASNMCPKGIIDIEDAFLAPLGYDVASALTTIDWFPGEGYEYVAQYRFSSEQKSAFIDAVERVLPLWKQVLEDHTFARAIWLSVRMHAWPAIQKFRYEKFMREFLTS